jgi:pilus assembly protein CpaE
MDKNNDSLDNKQAKEFALPRLNIAVYTIGNHLSDVVGQLMLDRRLVNSKISIFMGGIPAAINHYKDNLTPDMLIVELDTDLNNMMNDLFELSEVCDPGTRVVVAGKINDVELYRELIRNGISEYLVLPTTPIGIISVISNIYQDKTAVPLSPAIAFIGAMGGVGTSIIAQSVALNIADNCGIDTIFMDLDAAFPLSSLSWSVNPEKNIAHLIQASSNHVDEALLRRGLTKITSNLNLLISPMNPMVEWDYSHADVLSECIELAKSISDYTIFDIPAGRITVEKYVALLNASAVVIVTEPTIKGIRNLGVLYETINNLRPNDPPPKVILNKIDSPDATHLDINTIRNNIDITPDVSIRYVSGAIDLAISRGVPVSSLSGTTEFQEDIQQCTNLILGKQIAQPDDHSMVFKVMNNIKKAIGL